MDLSRSHDLDHLTMVLHNPDETPLHKRQAYRALNRIKRKMRDPKIKSLRLRLIKAQAASDPTEAEKISEELIAYEYATYGRG
jgi:hypothetical protein